MVRIEGGSLWSRDLRRALGQSSGECPGGVCPIEPKAPAQDCPGGVCPLPGASPLPSAPAQVSAPPPAGAGASSKIHPAVPVAAGALVVVGLLYALSR